MQLLLAALVLPVLGLSSASDDNLALVQDSLRVRSHGDLDSSDSWWIFGRHRRHGKAKAEPVQEASLPQHILESSMDSFGEAEAPGAPEETPEEEQVWLVAKPAAQDVAEAMKEAPAAKAPAVKEPTKEVPAKKADEAKKEATQPKTPAAAQQQQSMFKVGDKAQILDVTSGTLETGKWADCTITGMGHYPGTFNVHIPSAPAGYQDIKEMSVKFLRQPGAAKKVAPPPSAPQQPAAQPPKQVVPEPIVAAAAPQPTVAAQPAAQASEVQQAASPAAGQNVTQGFYNPYRYKVGDTMRVKVAGTENTWAPCRITKKGKDDDRYDLHIPLASPGHKDIKNIAASALVPFDPVEYAEIEKKFDDPNIDFGKTVAAMTQSPTSYDMGEACEVEIGSGPMKGKWVACVVVGPGPEERQFKIRAVDQEFTVPYYVLRKAQVHDVAEAPAPQEAMPAAVQAAREEVVPTEAPVAMPPTAEPPHFNTGDVAEVIVQDGPNKGSWIKVSITGQGKEPNTYNINTGFSEMKDIPAATLRAVDTATAWDI